MKQFDKTVCAGAPAFPAGNWRASPRATRRRIGRFRGLVLGYAGMLIVLSSPLPPAQARDTPLHQDSRSFRVHLGVVPARLLREQPRWVDKDKHLHGGLEQEPAAQHVTAALFDRAGDRRITDATVIARIQPKKGAAGPTLERPLEKMFVGGQLTYGNFFPMPGHGQWEIRLMIYLPQGEVAETLNFRYTKAEE